MTSSPWAYCVPSRWTRSARARRRLPGAMAPEAGASDVCRFFLCPFSPYPGPGLRPAHFHRCPHDSSRFDAAAAPGAGPACRPGAGPAAGHRSRSGRASHPALDPAQRGPCGPGGKPGHPHAGRADRLRCRFAPGSGPPGRPGLGQCAHERPGRAGPRHRPRPRRKRPQRGLGRSGCQLWRQCQQRPPHLGLRTLTEPDLLDRAVALAARQLAEPALPEAVWRRERERLVASLKEEDTRPGTQAGKAFARAVYGDHPYGYEMSAATLATIQVSDLRSYLKRSVRACDARVSLVGAVSREQADALVTRLLALLPAGPCQPQAAVPEVAPLTQAETLGLPFDSAQAHVFIGQPGIRRADPDYFALLVGNYILGGGGFVSRLTSEVREKRGLSYSVYSYFAPGLHAGAFTIGLQTRPDQAAEAVKVAREVLSRYVADGPTEAELKAAKDNLVGGFALRIDSNKKLLDNVANMALHGLPWDYLDTWTQQVEKVSVQDIRAAFERHLQPDRLVTVTVGARP